MTDRQRQTLKAIEKFQASKGYPPTIRDLATALGIRSTNGVVCHLNALEKKGMIRRSRDRARGITLLRRGIPLLELSDLSEGKRKAITCPAK